MNSKEQEEQKSIDQNKQSLFGLCFKWLYSKLINNGSSSQEEENQNRISESITTTKSYDEDNNNKDEKDELNEQNDDPNSQNKSTKNNITPQRFDRKRQQQQQREQDAERAKLFASRHADLQEKIKKSGEDSLTEEERIEWGGMTNRQLSMYERWALDDEYQKRYNYMIIK